MELDSTLELMNKGSNRGVPEIEEENLVSGDDCLYVLEIDDDGPLSAEDSRRVGQ